MLIFLTGADGYLAKVAIDQVKQKYLTKNPEGSELVEIDEATVAPNWSDLQAVPLFATSRLVIIRRAGLMAKASLEQLSVSLANLPSSTVVVLWDAKKISTPPELVELLNRAGKTIDVALPTGEKLRRWITARSKELGVELDRDSLTQLQAAESTWQLETELRTMASGASNSLSSRSASEPFALYSLIRRRDWAGVKKELTNKASLGEPIELVIGVLAGAVRKEVRDAQEATAITNLLIDLDVGVKTGLLDSEAAIALLVAHLPIPSSNRVQWETVWEDLV